MELTSERRQMILGDKHVYYAYTRRENYQKIDIYSRSQNVYHWNSIHTAVMVFHPQIRITPRQLNTIYRPAQNQIVHYHYLVVYMLRGGH